MKKRHFKPRRPNRSSFKLADVSEANLLREQFPFTKVPRVFFDGVTVPLDPAKEIWITDTTFRDGQQARPPYKAEHIVDLYRLMSRLGGPRGIIRQCEFFVYSKRDRAALEGCQALGLPFPEITGWIRANAADFQLVKALGLRETGILTSVSDYHIFLKLRRDRRKVMDQYLGVVKEALSAGVVPRCHFEDVTRADIYGFCLPFAEELMKLSEESGVPIKIRLCDTMGYGVTYDGAALPRSVPRLAHAFHRELGVPSELLEWHGHNDFHKVHINATSGWLYGISALNASLLGYGERTGNPPLEAAIIEYLALTGDEESVDTRVITEIASYFSNEVHAEIPDNYPFVGAQFNTTRAGIHIDGIQKNAEIYNIFDTELLLNRPAHITVTDKSGMAGIAHWLNDYARKIDPTREFEPLSKRHAGVRRIYEWVMEQYAQGRTTGISSDEMAAQAKRHVPSLFESNFQKFKKAAQHKGQVLVNRISASPDVLSLRKERMELFLKEVVRSEPSIQFLAITGLDGHQICQAHTQRGEKSLFRSLLKKNFLDHDWFREVISSGAPYASDLFFSRFTDKLIMTFAMPIRNQTGKTVAVMDVDFKFDELTQLINDLPRDIIEDE